MVALRFASVATIISSCLSQLVKGKMMKTIAWDVWLYGRVIDTVFYDCDMTEETVKTSLVNHDGYDSRICVREHCRLG